MQYKLILASASPERIALLKRFNIIPSHIINPNINETKLKKERPFALVKRLSLEKLLHVKNLDAQNISYIIAAKTVISRGALVLGRPKDIEEANNFLDLLSGRKHKVITGITVCNPQNKIVTKVLSTTVEFKRLSNIEIQNYLATNEWINQLGAYNIQGYAEIFIRQIIGSYSNILGLPTLTTYNLLKGLGYKTS